MKKTRWATILLIRCPNDLKHLKKVCSDIAKKDPNFKYHVDEDLQTVTIYSDSRSKAYKRGVWFHHKVNLPSGEKIYFEVTRL